MAEARRWRLWVRLPKQHFEYFEKYAAQLGIPMSQLIAMCAWSGARIVIPALDPPAYEVLKLIDEEQREEILRQVADQHFKEKEEWEEFQNWKKERGLQSHE